LIDSFKFAHPTINHATTQKRRDAPYCVQQEASLAMVPPTHL